MRLLAFLPQYIDVRFLRVDIDDEEVLDRQIRTNLPGDTTLWQWINTHGIFKNGRHFQMTIDVNDGRIMELPQGMKYPERSKPVTETHVVGQLPPNTKLVIDTPKPYVPEIELYFHDFRVGINAKYTLLDGHMETIKRIRELSYRGPVPDCLNPGFFYNPRSDVRYGAFFGFDIKDDNHIKGWNFAKWSLMEFCENVFEDMEENDE